MRYSFLTIRFNWITPTCSSPVVIFLLFFCHNKNTIYSQWAYTHDNSHHRVDSLSLTSWRVSSSSSSSSANSNERRIEISSWHVNEAMKAAAWTLNRLLYMNFTELSIGSSNFFIIYVTQNSWSYKMLRLQQPRESRMSQSRSRKAFREGLRWQEGWSWRCSVPKDQTSHWVLGQWMWVENLNNDFRINI